MVTRKKTVVEYTQKKMRRELKCFTLESQLNAKEVMQEMWDQKKAIKFRESKQQNDGSLSLSVCNYFKFKWIKLKRQIGRRDIKI